MRWLWLLAIGPSVPSPSCGPAASEGSGRFTLSVLARAGTCSEPPVTGGLSGVIDVV